MPSRRRFLAAATTGALAGPALLRAAAGDPAAPELVILHTNDTHSRIDPFPQDGGDFAGLGGVAPRLALVEEARRAHPDLLLLDSGDFFQGTPYFNKFGGAIELQALSRMRLDVSTLGNHEFDNGVEALADKLAEHARFEVVNANYDLSRTPLRKFVRPWTILPRGGRRIGIFGVGVDLDGLIAPAQREGLVHTDPLAAARRCVRELRGRGCDLVICLSHLGYRRKAAERGPFDVDLAAAAPGLDLILGGHSHDFMDGPHWVEHPAGAAPTAIHQVGHSGIRLGRVEFHRAGPRLAAHFPRPRLVRSA